MAPRKKPAAKPAAKANFIPLDGSEPRARKGIREDAAPETAKSDATAVITDTKLSAKPHIDMPPPKAAEPKTVKMYRDDALKPCRADVHPAEVGHMRAHGWLLGDPDA